jgi:hypothetical protein
MCKGSICKKWRLPDVVIPFGRPHMPLKNSVKCLKQGRKSKTYLPSDQLFPLAYFPELKCHVETFKKRIITSGDYLSCGIIFYHALYSIMPLLGKTQ